MLLLQSDIELILKKTTKFIIWATKILRDYMIIWDLLIGKIVQMGK